MHVYLALFGVLVITWAESIGLPARALDQAQEKIQLKENR